MHHSQELTEKLFAQLELSLGSFGKPDGNGRYPLETARKRLGYTYLTATSFRRFISEDTEIFKDRISVRGIVLLALNSPSQTTSNIVDRFCRQQITEVIQPCQARTESDVKLERICSALLNIVDQFRPGLTKGDSEYARFSL